MRVPASGAIIGEAEKGAMHRAVDRGWLTASGMNTLFEQKLQSFTGISHARTCNSGSSANLLAVAAMVEGGFWKAGDEVITVAAGFPTTLNPLLLYGLKPVFVDVELPTYQVNVDQLARAVSHRTRGIMIAHTLGNPFSHDVREIAKENGLMLIEDCCDALGAEYLVADDGYHVGADAAVATFSFFPAHHITTGEGGAVLTGDSRIAGLLQSIRDWGRDCFCEPGQNNSCGKRFGQQFGRLPAGYDHKYTFTRLGFNLKLTEISAACGVAQIEQIGAFVAARRKNFDFLKDRLSALRDHLILPEATPGTHPSWFGFPITLHEEGLRTFMQEYLAQNGVDSRLVFGGNLVRQPYMEGRPHIVASELRVTDQIMRDSLWIGLHPALTEEQLAYAADQIATCCGSFV